MQNWIAEESFRCEPRTGESFTVSVKIAEPTLEAVGEGDTRQFGQCAISMEPLISENWVRGVNKFQALCLAIDYVRKAFKIFSAEGGRVYFRNTNGIVDLNDPWFCPMISIEELQKQSTTRQGEKNK